MKNKPLSAWFKQLRDEYECTRWLKHENADVLAAKALFHLNRGAKNNTQRDTIYALKTLVLEEFYKRGYCVSVCSEVQELICLHCEGSGYDPYEWDGEFGHGVCERCGGSGIYATHYLYSFVFSIGGQTYNWHQPQKLVSWHVSDRVDYMTDYTGAAQSYWLPDIMLTHYIAVLRAYLILAGIKRVPSLTLREAIKTSARWWWMNQVNRWPRPYWFKPIFKTFWAYKDLRYRWKFRNDPMGDIPF